MFKNRWLTGILGLVMGLVLATAATAGAAQINVVMATGMHFNVNGVDKTPANGTFDNQGVPVPDGFVYDGTTYVPIRMVANLVGQPVSYQSQTRTVEIGYPPTGVYLEDVLKPYYVSGSSGNAAYGIDGNMPNNLNGQGMFMAGQQYQKGFAFYDNACANGNDPATYTFNLNGQYQSLAFTLGLDDQYNKDQATVVFQGDGQNLLTLTLNPGDLPKQETINVTGVQQLKIETSDYQDCNWNTDSVVDMVNPLITR